MVATQSKVFDGGLRRRLAEGFAAQGLGQILTIVIQVASVPLFLGTWGQAAYGEWLLLSAVYLYFSLADLGFGSAAANEMAMLAGAGKREKVQGVYQSAWATLCAISLAVFGLGLGLFFLLPLKGLLQIATLSSNEIRLVLGVLLANVVLAQQGAMFEAAYRCDGKFARGICARNAVRFFEFLVTVAVLAAGGGMALLAAGMLLSRAAVYAVTYLDLRRSVPWLRLGLGEARVATIRPLIAPALAYNAFPLGHALAGQGVLTLVGIVFGPAAVVLVSTARTLTRVAQQAIKSMAEALWPEFSRALGGGNVELARNLHRRIVILALFASVGAVAALLILGPAIFQSWTSGKVPLDLPIFALFALATIPAGLWGASYAVPLSTNQHGSVAAAFVALSAVTLAVAALLAPVWGIRGVGVAVLIAESAMAAFVLRRSLQMLDDTPRAFFKGFAPRRI